MLRSVTFLLLLFFMTTICVVLWKNLPTALFSDAGVEVEDLESLRRFNGYIRKFNRSYGNGDYFKRLQYFKESLKEISRLNALNGSAVYGLTKFSDWSPEELSKLWLSRPTTESCEPRRAESCKLLSRSWMPYERSRGLIKVPYLDLNPPLEWDWRKEGKIGSVIDQKRCNGCWAMGIVGVMESMWAVQGNKFYSLSIQELMDCDYKNKGCGGGDIGVGLNFLCSHDYPVVGEWEYRLKLIDEQCHFASHRPGSGRRIAEFTTTCYMNESLLVSLIANHGPVVAVVNSKPWLHYESGVIDRACDSEWANMVHVVQIVGYNKLAEVPYYIARNSWGYEFGEGGYVKVAMNMNMCGISSNVAYFTVK